MHQLRFLRPRFAWITFGVLALAAALAATITEWRFHPEVPDTDLLHVPLGVEQAAIVTYSGARVSVAPYKWGVAVNVRLAAVQQKGETRVYDVRYIVNREGTFDLRDYLAAEDGSKLQGLPSFQFHGDPKLSKNLDTRIRETEEVTVEIVGHYYQVLAGLGLIWILWLLLLLFYKRPQPPASEAPAPPVPTLTELLQGYLAQLQTGSLDAAAKARLEMLLLRHWRAALALESEPMHASVAAIERHRETGAAWHLLRGWLHDPHSRATSSDIAQALAPFAQTPATVPTTA